MAGQKLTADEVFALARKHASAGRVLESTKLCETLLNLLPQDTGLYRQTSALLDQLTNGMVSPSDRQRLMAILAKNDYAAAFQAVNDLLTRYPDDPFLLGFLGTVYYETGRPRRARDAFNKAIARAPSKAGLHAKLGLVYKQLQQTDQALACFDRAVALNPNHNIALANKALVLADRGKLWDALDVCETALGTASDHPGLLTSKGMILDKLGRHGDALTVLDRALAQDPDYIKARLCRAHILLAQGRYADGWRELEWRWRRPDVRRPTPHGSRLWRGQPLDGKRIIILAEQGLGDQIQFVRYATQLAKRGATVIVECHAKLVRLLSTCPGVSEVIAKGTPLPKADYHCPGMSIPAAMAETQLTAPPQAYLSTGPSHSATWHDWLADLPGYRVGIHWQGNPKYRDDRWRSFPLAHYGVLADIPGVSLVSLQKGDPATDQEACFRADHKLADLDSLAGRETDLDDAAAAICHLDLIVTNCTSIAHLSGALGRPTWVILGHAPDWRWMHDRTDSPWYPTVRLFRQKTIGEWAPVFDTVAQSLKRTLAELNEES